MVEPQIRSYLARDGYRLHYRHWRPERDRPVARVVAMHGIQSHSGWYTFTSRRLCEAGFELFFLDRRGSGMNEAPRGHAPDHQTLLSDVTQLLTELRGDVDSQTPRCPLVLLAISWSAKVAAVIAATRPELLDGVALLYPGIVANLHLRWDQNLRLRLAWRLGLALRQVAIPLQDPGLFTSSAEWQEFIAGDPLALHQVTVSFLIANRNLDRLARTVPAEIHCPALLMLAGHDRIIDNAATRKYFERIASPHRSEIEYPGAQHTLEFEPDREHYVANLRQWLEMVAHGV